MTNRSTTPPESLAVALYDAYHPALTAGAYRVVMQQSVALDGTTDGKAHHYYRDDAFFVQSPRYHIDENDIHAHYPPAGAMGDFNRHIPNIVLRKRALPWERVLAVGPDRRAPWMALFLLTEEEFQDNGGEAAIQVVKPSALLRPDRKSTDGAVLLPKLTMEPGGDADDLRVTVIDLGRSLAQSACPSLDDLPLLVHVRKVPMQDKPREPMHGAGEFPVVAARRVPAPGPNVALLVSLEGWEELIDGAGHPPLPSEPDRLRMVVLVRWRFTNNPDHAHSFSAVAQRMTIDTLRFAPPAQTPAAFARPLGLGYTPMPYRMADGDSVLAWYRGPFVPEPTQALPFDEFAHADAALILSPDDDALILSHAAAWQLGRLMALSSPSFLAATRAFIRDDAGPREVAARLDTFMVNHVQAIRREWAQREWAAKADPAQPPPEDADTQPPGYFRAAMTMVEWLGALVRLDGVPFTYLVAGEQTLPASALRFFHVDANWLLALANGALSLSGCRTSPRAAQGPSMRVLVSRLVERFIAGTALTANPEGGYLDRPKTGFLLRSTLVSDWPGLETVVATVPEAVRPYRLERLADDLLLGLCDGRIASITLKEPPEAVAFRLKTEREEVPEPDQHGFFSPLARCRAEAALGLSALVPSVPGGSRPGPLTASAFAASSMSSGTVQTFLWGNTP